MEWTKEIAKQKRKVQFDKWKKPNKGRRSHNREKAQKGDSKVPMHQKFNIYINNERCINSIAKRQQLAKHWEAEKMDVTMMGETQKNTGGMEQGPVWANEYIVFYSTGIYPKTRGEQEKKRQKKWDKQTKPRRRKIGRRRHL